MLSPCGSQITITPDAGPDDSAPGDTFELKWEFDVTMFHFPMISSGAQLGVIGTGVACWVIFYFSVVVGP